MVAFGKHQGTTGKDRSRGDSTHQNKEKYLETLAEETRAEKEKYAVNGKRKKEKEN